MANSSPDSFSQRFGHSGSEPPITIREDAPDKLRYGLIQVSAGCGVSPRRLRPIVCAVLRERPDPSNWSEYPNIESEVDSLISNCEWFKVYDIIEAVFSHLYGQNHNGAKRFEGEMNKLFRELGVGWQLRGGLLESRGDDEYESTLSAAKIALSEASLVTAGSELAEAIRDMSRRPEPDLSGAIHHAMSALEAVARRLTSDGKSTLGEIVKRYPDLLPKPLDVCVSKAWGFASENARHGNEDRELSADEARLVVGLAAVLATYLAAKIPTDE